MTSDLPALPASLASLLELTAPEVTFELANSNLSEALFDVRAALATELGQVTPRVVIEFANASSSYSLAYPVELIGDTTAPVITGVSSKPLAGNSAEIPGAPTNSLTARSAMALSLACIPFRHPIQSM